MPAVAKQRVRSIESAAIAGVAYAVLAFTALTLLTRQPALTLTEAELTEWFAQTSNRTPLVLALNLAAISSVAFLWFVAVIRRRIGNREDRFFTTVFLGSGILYVAIWLVAAALLAAPAVAMELFSGGVDSDPASHTLMAGTAGGLLLVAGPRVQAVFVLTTSTLVLRAKVLPNWLAYFGYAVGLILFVMPLIAMPVGIGFPGWVLVVSITILFSRGPAEMADETT